MANIFPKWVNTVPIKVIVAIVLIKTAIVIGITYYFSPQYTRVGYAPTQPVAFSHEFHAGPWKLIVATVTPLLSILGILMYLAQMFACLVIAWC